MKITKVSVLQSYGTDTISLYTEYPCPYVPEYDDNPLCLTFSTTKGMGVDYIRENFGVEPEIIDTQRGGIIQEWNSEPFEI